MNILLDECTPRVVKRRLPGMRISTVQEVGWGGLKNGELLAAADGRFDVFVTTDKNLRRQQNLTKYRLAVILPPSNQVPVVGKLVPASEAVPATIQPGDFIEVPLP